MFGSGSFGSGYDVFGVLGVAMSVAADFGYGFLTEA